MIDTTTKQKRVQYFYETLTDIKQIIELENNALKYASLECVQVVEFWLRYLQALGYDIPATFKEPPRGSAHGVPAERPPQQ